MEFATLLAARGLTSGPVYVSGLHKGRDLARMIADFKAQETIFDDHDRIIIEADAETEGQLIERLARFYHSDYVKHNQPWVRKIPYDEWIQRELSRRSGVAVHVE